MSRFRPPFLSRGVFAPDPALPLETLRGSQHAGGVLDDVTALVPGLSLRRDPEGAISGNWRSPARRLLDLETQVTRPGAWLALHLSLPLTDLRGVAWFGLVARSAADRALVVRPCLRSGHATGGFHDQFFARHMLSQPAETDHHDLIAPDRIPGLPMVAPWRELILFLPPAHGIRWALHDLRLVVV